MWTKIPRPFAAANLAALAGRAAGGVWLDDNGTSADARFSFVGVDPYAEFRVKDGWCELSTNGCIERRREDPWAALAREIRSRRRPPALLPLLQGGVIGYLGYDMGRYLERLPAGARPDDTLPEAWFGFYDLLVIVDHYRGETWLVSTGGTEGGESRQAAARLAYLEGLVEKAFVNQESAGLAGPPARLTADFSRRSYMEAVTRVKEYIAAGDVFQVNLSQRLRADYQGDPMVLYYQLRHASPVPFGAYLNLGEAAVLCVSPELFLRVRGEEVTTRPIKGTAGRVHVSAAEDRRAGLALQASEKDRAELVMIVDLLRNDLGRVCRPGSIRVPRLCTLESYADVHHLSATIAGRLAPDKDVFDLLPAAFPGGSITGAPKVRAMEIIDELEPVRRGVYTGSIGYLGFDGDAEFNIAIRTAWISGGKVYYQAGGGVVADSNPEREYEETLQKAACFLRALGREMPKGVDPLGVVLD